MEITKLKEKIEQTKSQLNKLKGQKESYEKTKKDLIKKLKADGINSFGDLKKKISALEDKIESETKKMEKEINALDIEETEDEEE